MGTQPEPGHRRSGPALRRQVRRRPRLRRPRQRLPARRLRRRRDVRRGGPHRLVRPQRRRRPGPERLVPPGGLRQHPALRQCPVRDVRPLRPVRPPAPDHAERRRHPQQDRRPQPAVAAERRRDRGSAHRGRITPPTCRPTATTCSSATSAPTGSSAAPATTRSTAAGTTTSSTSTTTWPPTAAPTTSPDTNTSYEDRAFGGAGLDVLIANTGGDRLIDWVGEFNTLPGAVRTLRGGHDQPNCAAGADGVPLRPVEVPGRGPDPRPAVRRRPGPQRRAVRRARPDPPAGRGVAGPDRWPARPAGRQHPRWQPRRAPLGDLQQHRERDGRVLRRLGDVGRQ